ncbi:CBM96 family carbohydrate-binding protein [Paenibacillus sp. strain BS8-2]
MMMNINRKRAARRYVALVLAVCLTVPQLFTSPTIIYADEAGAAEPVVVSLIPTDDTYISGFYNTDMDERNRNFNYKNELLARDNPGYPQGQKKSLLKFDLSGLNGVITEAKLEVHAKSDSVDGAMVGLYKTSAGLGDGWTETNMTWNSGYEAGEQIASPKTVVKDSSAEWDITNYIVAEHMGDSIASIMLQGANTSFAILYAKDHPTAVSANKQPRLMITYIPDEPATEPAVAAYTGAQVSADFMTIILGFDMNIEANTADLKAGVALSRDGEDFSPLSDLDTVAITDGNQLSITLQQGLAGSDNRIRVAAGTLKGLSGGAIELPIETELLNGTIDLSAYSRIETLKLEHPRLLATADDWEIMQNRLTESPYLEWYTKVKGDATALLYTPVNTYNKESADQLLPISRSVKDRIMQLAMVYRLEGATEYAERAWKELEAVSSPAFPDWNPGHFLDTAEMTAAVAIGYDWLYDYLSAEQRTTVRTALLNKGLNVGLETYRGATGDWNRHGWLSTKSNWNLVANGGLGMGALAIADEYPELAQEVIDSGLASMEVSLAEFAPDGGWVESVTYWYYSIKYLVEYMASLESALGTTFGLEEFEGINNTGYFPIYMTGPTDKSFHFGDAGNGTVRSAEFFWLAEQFNQPVLNGWRESNLTSGDYKDIIYYNPFASSQSPIEAELPLDDYFRNVESVSFRSGWEQPNATYVGFKAGTNNVTHSDLDVGTFVLDALGVRWAEELGAESYAVPNYFDEGEDGRRWNYYRKRAEGQNVLVINAGTEQEQTLLGTAKIDTMNSDDDEAYAISDLTPVYDEVRDSGGSVKRGIQLFDHRRQVLLQDEMSFTEPSDVWWFMHTGTNVKVAEDGQSAILTLGDKRLWARILTPEEGLSFTLRDAEPLLSSPDTTGSGEYDRSGLKKLAIHAQNVSELQLAVWFVPLREGESLPTELPAVADLEAWTLNEETPAQLDSLSVDGTVLPDFAPGQYTYDVTVEDSASAAPIVTASSTDANIHIEMEQAAGLPGTAIITVTSHDESLAERVYHVHFNYAISKTLVVTANGSDGNAPENTLDGSLSTRWSAMYENNTPQWIRYYLGETPRTIEEVGIAFFNGHTRQTIFDIETSLDGVHYSKVYSGRSGGATSELETFTLNANINDPDHIQPPSAKYIRIVGYGNTANGWNSITEVQIDGVTHPDAGQVTVKSLTVEGKKQLQVKEAAQWIVQALLSDNSEVSATGSSTTVYYSSDPAVAAVSASGVVTGVSEGNAVIGIESTINHTTKSIRVPVTVTDPNKISMIPSADSYIRGGQYAGSNYGSAAELPMKSTNPQGIDYIRLPLFKFDVTGITELPDKVVLKLYGNVKDDPNSALGDQPYWAELFGTSAEWNENAVNWSNVPELGDKAGDIAFNKTLQWVSVDVTEYVLNQLEQNETMISFRLNPVTQEALVSLSSKESNFKPLLVFEYEEESPETTPDDNSIPSAPGNGHTETWNEVDEGLESVIAPQAPGAQEAAVKVLQDKTEVERTVERLKNMPADKQRLIVNMTDQAAGKAVSIPVASLDILRAQLGDLTITIKSEEVSYDLRLDAVDWTAALKDLGVEAADASLQIRMEIIEEGSVRTSMLESAARSGLEVAAPAVHFSIEVIAGNQVKELNSFPGSYLSRFIKLDSNTDTSRLTGVLYHPADNSFSFVPTVIHREDGGAIAELKRDGNSIYTVVSTPEVSFSDLEGHFAQDAINRLSANLLTTGYPEGDYRPNRSITRAEFNALLVRGLGLSADDAGGSFVDVREEDWFAATVMAGTSAGLIYGYEDGSFKPNQTITREEMAMMLVRAMGYVQVTEHNLSNRTASSSMVWQDAHQISEWAQAAVTQAVQAGLMLGKQDSVFAPDHLATRGEAAVTLDRLLLKLAFINP